ncbi:hypothetical protein E8E11_003189 [Didymella keratinophila]|nr:hypothetical protein E8E11_003189 [Didymella keratinophila]
MSYEKVALKDVMWLDVNEQIDVVTRYALWDGVYMFHCHNLIHKDHEMLAAFNITALADFGYNETTRFVDPMNPQYRAGSFNDGDYSKRNGPFSESEIKKKLDWFVKLDAYNKVDEVEKALAEYWSIHKSGATASATRSATESATGSETSMTGTANTSKTASDDKKTTTSAAEPAPTTFKTSTTSDKQKGKNTSKTKESDIMLFLKGSSAFVWIILGA